MHLIAIVPFLCFYCTVASIVAVYDVLDDDLPTKDTGVHRATPPLIQMNVE